MRQNSREILDIVNGSLSSLSSNPMLSKKCFERVLEKSKSRSRSSRDVGRSSGRILFGADGAKPTIPGFGAFAPRSNVQDPLPGGRLLHALLPDKSSSKLETVSHWASSSSFKGAAEAFRKQRAEEVHRLSFTGTLNKNIDFRYLKKMPAKCVEGPDSMRDRSKKHKSKYEQKDSILNRGQFNLLVSAKKILRDSSQKKEGSQGKEKDLTQFQSFGNIKTPMAMNVAQAATPSKFMHTRRLSGLQDAQKKSPASEKLSSRLLSLSR